MQLLHIARQCLIAVVAPHSRCLAVNAPHCGAHRGPWQVTCIHGSYSLMFAKLSGAV